MMKAKLLFLSFLISVSFLASAQTDSIEVVRDYKNLVRYNLTPTLVLGTGSYVFGYERVLKPHRSFSVNAGFIQIPQLASNILDTLQIDRATKRNGFSFAADYRFYFKKRNKRNAPDGLYWGPYFAAYYFDTDLDVEVFEGGGLKGYLSIQSDMLFLMGGVELGYQFVLGKNERWTIDLVLAGPAIRYYIINIKAQANYEGEINDDYLEGIVDALTSIFPGFGQLSREGELNSSGFTSGFGAGYRYVVQVGYRF